MIEVYFLIYTKVKTQKWFVEIAINQMWNYFAFALVKTA